MSKNKVVTVPNVISIVRIVLIPIIVWTYMNETLKYHLYYSGVLLLLSGISDCVDGYIARKFQQVSDFGKILDPIADKLTQGAVVLCLFIKHPNVLPLMAVLFTKEILTLIFATYMLNNGTKAISAKWWGKASTVFIYLTMLVTLLSDIINSIPEYVITGLALLSVAMLFVSMIGYFGLFFVKKDKNIDNLGALRHPSKEGK